MATEKIIYVVTKGNLGGAQRYVYDLATALPRERWEAVVATGEGPWLSTACTRAGIRAVTLPSLGRDVSLAKDIASLFDLVRLFRSERPAIVHLNSSKIGALGSLAARVAGVPKVIFTAHGWAYNEKRSPISKAAFWLAHALTMLLADVTIANSAHTARTAPLRKGLITIRLGIAPTNMLSREEAQKALSVSGMTLGTIAELHTNKGLDVFIKAFASLEGAPQLVIIGSGEEKKNLEGADRVHLVGHKDDATQYLPAFDIFVLPSRTESLGYVLLEAGLAGLPVVAANVGGIPEIIEDSVTGLLVPSEDPEALAGAIEKLRNDGALRQKLGSALKQKVLRDFSVDRMIAETVGQYGD